MSSRMLSEQRNMDSAGCSERSSSVSLWSYGLSVEEYLLDVYSPRTSDLIRNLSGHARSESVRRVVVGLEILQEKVLFI